MRKRQPTICKVCDCLSDYNVGKYYKMYDNDDDRYVSVGAELVSRDDRWRQSIHILVILAIIGSHGCLAFSCMKKCYQFNVIKDTNDWTSRNINHLKTTTLFQAGMSDREREIRLKIQKLKQQGKINQKKNIDKFEGMDDDIDDYDDNEVKNYGSIKTDYSVKIQQKLGSKKSKILGFPTSTTSTNIEDFTESLEVRGSQVRSAQIGSLASTDLSRDSTSENVNEYQRQNSGGDTYTDDIIVDDDEYDDSKLQLDEIDLVNLVAEKMKEKRDREQLEKLEKLEAEAIERRQQIEQQRLMEKDMKISNEETRQITSGVGGLWSKDSSNANSTLVDTYQPKTGSWGAFPRPRDISKAYGGGRRVGPGFSNEAEKLKSEEETREKLRSYRVKMGIEVESEKEHAAEINDALAISNLAMQRGIYSTAVSALEKVTKYCSTNSKVGGKVFLELAMAYEAVGRTQEAITVYSTLSRSRIEKIKINAKRLLYGIEAMQFMQEHVKSSEFSRSKARTTFIDTTGLADIASKFDDRYETAYIDLSSKSNFYKRLTESVVRSPREARQVLLMATGPGEVERLRVVQALRSLSRKFDEALESEIERNAPAPEPIALMDGKPILQQLQQEPKKRVEAQYTVDNDFEDEELDELLALSDEYVLSDPSRMMRYLDGEWRLQLLADKRGDGVKYFNSTQAWQVVDTSRMSFTSQGPSAFLSIQHSGKISFNEKRRILRRADIETSNVMGGMMLAGWFGSQLTGAVGAICTPQQVVMVDSVLLMTRHVPSRYTSGRTSTKSNTDEVDRDYFAVWRRVSAGTYSSLK